MLKKILLLLVLIPLNALAQAPDWLNADYRRTKYPADKYFIGFSIYTIQKGDDISEIVVKAKDAARVEAIQSIKVHVENITIDERSSKSVEDSHIFEETIEGTFVTKTKLTTDLEITDVHVEVYRKKNNVYAFCYIPRTEMDKIYDARKEKVYDFIKSANEALETAKVGVALRYYYWALKLLLWLPEQIQVNMTNPEGILLSSDITNTMNTILSDIVIAPVAVRNGLTEIQLTYHNIPISSCDFEYFDGYDWIPTTAKDGKGLLDTHNANIPIRIEYVNQSLWKSDPIVNNVMSQNPSVIPFPLATKTVSTTTAPALSAASTYRQMLKTASIDTISTCSKADFKQQLGLIYPIVKTIDSGNYDDVRELFSDEGWDWFTKLIKYGDAKIIEEPQLTVTSFANGFLVRGVKARFKFNTNHRTFVEDLVFYVKDSKIESISFGLEQSALEDISRHGMWNADSRLILINFLENYKTAYALERLDYLDAIFSDDALIIVGHRLPQKRQSEVATEDGDMYEHNKLSKSEYIKNLERVFKKQEYVNIQFEDAQVKKTGQDLERYQILIKQNYYSTTYADKGYLFLLADLENPEKPIIHVRVWDEDKNDLMDYGEWNY